VIDVICWIRKSGTCDSFASFASRITSISTDLQALDIRASGGARLDIDVNVYQDSPREANLKSLNPSLIGRSSCNRCHQGQNNCARKKLSYVIFFSRIMAVLEGCREKLNSHVREELVGIPLKLKILSCSATVYTF